MIRFICAQPANLYYAWQVEVMINNFIKVGINPNQIDIVCWKIGGVIPEEWSKLANHYPCRFFFYDDTRRSRHYISSIRPNILKQHFTALNELQYETIFYHDCDIAFAREINWGQYLTDDKWYGSDTRWYIGHDYIISKGEDILDKMCEIVGIDKGIVKDNELNCIGAQYLLKGIDSMFWERVERDCENLYRDITAVNNIKKLENPSYHELQIWCADMWAVLWNGWKMGRETVTHSHLDFSWATSHVDEWNKHSIFHNAGVTGGDGMFFKANYINKLPYGEEIDVRQDRCSYNYWLEVQETGKKSVLL